MNADLSTFSGRLNWARNNALIRPIALAKAVGVNRGYISFLLSGHRRNPSPALLEKIAATLNVRSEWLRTGSGVPNRENSRRHSTVRVKISINGDAETICSALRGLIRGLETV